MQASLNSLEIVSEGQCHSAQYVKGRIYIQPLLLPSSSTHKPQYFLKLTKSSLKKKINSDFCTLGSNAPRFIDVHLVSKGLPSAVEGSTACMESPSSGFIETGRHGGKEVRKNCLHKIFQA